METIVLIAAGTAFFLWLMGPTLSEFTHACWVLRGRRSMQQPRETYH